jgi:phage/plasmid-like protein (TIGR03299 family)
MPANVGDMFYTGKVPWHGEGLPLARPATLPEALKAGGLEWEVGYAELLTGDDPPSPVPMRKAIVRLDRPAGHQGRVLGVAHRGFQPVQNKDGAMLFDAIFGRGSAVYETGGYLGDGQVIWLLARIDKERQIASEDVIQPYALLANSHDGSIAFTISLTTVRVVCQNTLAVALQQKVREQFRRAHQGSLRDHAQAAQRFFASTLQQLDQVTSDFVRLTTKECRNQQFEEILVTLLPTPKKPANADTNPGLRKAWETNVERVEKARTKIRELRESGRGMNLNGSRGTLWGVLNAVLEYVDHHQLVNGDRLAHALLGDGMDLKQKAFRIVLDRAA